MTFQKASPVVRLSKLSLNSNPLLHSKPAPKIKLSIRGNRCSCAQFRKQALAKDLVASLQKAKKHSDEADQPSFP
ncbi:MAG: hypothetical protein K2Y32_11170 [Candidatus Obscuribacterales bacterium]|nr:hypothetical protein [Candidatus Obscuribacterales bacterium]